MLNQDSIINNYENIILKNNQNNWEILAKIDTGADYSSLDLTLAKKLDLLNKKKYLGNVFIKNSNGITKREMYWTEIILKNKKRKIIFNPIDRKNLTYKMIIGRADLKNFLIKPSQEKLHFLQKITKEKKLD